MRFPNPVPRPCASCGQPTVLAETSIGSERVHCGTWRRRCHTFADGAGRETSRVDTAPADRLPDVRAMAA